jgi:hypothetical protein
MSLFYIAMGITRENFFHSLLTGDPYCFSRSTALRRIAQRLLEHNVSTRALFRVDPFAKTGQAPKYIRCNLHMFSPEHNKANGEPPSFLERVRVCGWVGGVYVCMCVRAHVHMRVKLASPHVFGASRLQVIGGAAATSPLSSSPWKAPRTSSLPPIPCP